MSVIYACMLLIVRADPKGAGMKPSQLGMNVAGDNWKVLEEVDAVSEADDIKIYKWSMNFLN